MSLLPGLFLSILISVYCLVCDPVVCPASIVPIIQVGDGECDLQCNRPACSFDSSQSGLSDCFSECMSTGCPATLLSNSVCDQACNSPACGFDMGNCQCAAMCTADLLANSQCDRECDSWECYWDNGQCVSGSQGQCADGCWGRMLGDTVCQEECDTALCGFDGGDCGCTKQCRSSLLGKCDPDCMNFQCGFDAFAGKIGCKSLLLVIASVYQMVINRTFSATFRWDSCRDSTLDCDLPTYEQHFSARMCLPGCNTKQCSYAMGLCGGNVPINCEVGYSEEFGSCLRCKSGFVLFFGVCLKQCPHGYAVKPDFGWICADLADFSTAESPDLIYVASYGGSEAADGSRKSPYISLQTALYTAKMAYTRVNLIGTTVSFAFIHSENWVKAVLQKSQFDPLIDANAVKFIEIRSLKCSDEMNENCSESPTEINISEIVTISVKNGTKFELNFVKITSKSAFGDIGFRYCPYISQEFDGKHWNDRYEVANETAVKSHKICEGFHAFSLFVILEGGEMTVNYVNFTDFGVEMRAIFELQQGILTLDTVCFENVQIKPGSAAILQLNSYRNGTFRYRNGFVTLINNGFEAKMDGNLSPFLQLEQLNEVYIGNVTISFSLISNFEGNIGLFMLKNVPNITIDKCKFNDNLSLGYLLKIESISINPSGDNVEFDDNSPKISLTNSEFARNYAKMGVFRVISGGNLGRISISNCTFREIASAQFLSLESPNSLPISTTSGVNITNSAFFRNFAFQSLIFIRKFPNISLSLLTFYQNNSTISANSAVSYYINAEFTYAKQNPIDTVWIDCDSSVVLSETTNVSIGNVSVAQCECKEGTIGVVFRNANGQNEVKNCLFDGNSAKSGAITSVSTGDFRISGLKMAQNRFSANGSIQIAQNCSLFLTDSLFESNSAQAGTCLYAHETINITIENVTFRSNSAATMGGAVLITPRNGGKVTVNNCIFRGNSAMIGAAMAVLLSEFEGFIGILVNESRFWRNSAKDSGASLYIGDRINVGLEIENSDFEAENSPEGAVSLRNQYGFVLIHDSVFRNNSGISASDLLILTGNSAKNTLKNVTFNGSRFAPAIFKPKNQIFSSLVTIDCKFVGSSNSALRIEYAQWEDYGSVFKSGQNTAISLSNASKVSMDHSNFQSNISPKSGGAVSISFESEFHCFWCDFSENIANAFGGAIFSETNSVIVIENCVFEENTSKKAGSVLYSESCQLRISLSELRLNTDFSYGLIAISNSDLTLDSVTIHDNVSPTFPGISANFSGLTVTNSNFFGQNGDFAAVFDVIFSQLSLETSQFRNIFGTVIFAQTTNVTVYQCDFNDINAVRFGVIFGSDRSAVSLNSVKTDKIPSKFGHFVSNSSVIIANSLFQRSGDVCIFVENSDFISIANVTFEGGNGQFGSAIYCSDCTVVVISESKFVENRANFGTVYVESSLNQGKATLVSVSNSEFRGNIADFGGGIYALDCDLAVSGSNFSYNSAAEEGAGVFSSCRSHTFCALHLTHSVFHGNAARMAGGGMAWKSAKPDMDNITFEGNSAAYGPNVASEAAMLRVTTKDNPTNRVLDATSVISSLPPGRPARTQISIELLDPYSQLLSLDSSTQIELSPTDPSLASLFGLTRLPVSHGLVSFSGFTVYTQPGTTLNMTIKAYIMSVDPWGAATYETLTTFLTFQMRTCVPGESKVTNGCMECSADTYGFDPALPCQNCPLHAQCLGNYSIVPDSGYWRSSAFSAKILRCPKATACLGGSVDLSQAGSLTGRCDVGYEGNLCQSCAVDYSRTGRNKCTICPNLPVNVVRIVFIAVAAVVLVSLLVWSSMRSASRPAAIHSVYLKIFLNYLQLVSLVGEFKLNWPDTVLQLFEIQQSMGGVSEQLLSIDCFLARNGNATDVYYWKLIYMTAIPVLCGAGVVGYWLAIAIYRRKKKKLRRQMPATLVIVFFFLHPTVGKALFAVFNCGEIERGEYWLTQDMDIRCWDETHLKNVLRVGIPGLIVWVLGVPLICFIQLIRLRNRLTELWIRLPFGFLINGYKRRRFYWEFVVIYRKITIICCSVFLTQFTAVQALTVQIILSLYFFLQYEINPYTHIRMNNMELRAIVVADLTIYCGLFYLTEELTVGASWFFFAVILIVNVVFVSYWINAIVQYFLRILSKKVPFIGKIFMPEILTRDDYIDRFIAMFEHHSQGKYDCFCYSQMKDALIAMIRNSNAQVEAIPTICKSHHSYSPSIPEVVDENAVTEERGRHLSEGGMLHRE